ncbi:hypothetical protein vseg_018871 [Gypsophila vaccaria]
MEVEAESKGKALEYKIKASSRETSSQKAANVVDADLRNYWSTGTNTKEWILLELQEPCLLSQIRVHNKSVLEWEIAAGLRYKPETFVKVRPRCEAPRRDVVYPMNYTPCRYVRLSCLRGSPIAIFFIQLIGISVPGLEPEFQPLVNHILPQILGHEQDSAALHLQLLQDITERLHTFLPQLEAELMKYADESEASTRFLAMLAGPFYPILQIVSEREAARCSTSGLDSEVFRTSQPVPPLIVSSNFEPRRSSSISPFPLLTSRSIVFRPDAIFLLLRKAFVDKDLGAVCKVVSRIFHYLAETTLVQEESSISIEGASSLVDEGSGPKLSSRSTLSDYSEFFGVEFAIPSVGWDASYVNVLDIGALEEAILHVLYACAAEPLLCSKLAGSAGDFWLVLPLIQALSPALCPFRSAVNVDDTFSLWAQPFVQQALSKIVSTLSSSMYHPLLHGCAGYLASFSPSHVKTACILIDLCSSALAPWMPLVTAKIDLAVELLGDLLGVIKGESHSLVRVRAALKYLVLALSGYMDEVLAEYKEAKLGVLFLIEMLETFLEPALSASQNMIGFGEISGTSVNNHETLCTTALQVIRAAVRKPSVLPSLELEWRLGSVPPTVLLSILDPHLQLPPEIDHCKSSLSKPDKETSACFPSSHVPCGGSSSKSFGQDDGDGSTDNASKLDIPEDASLLFAPEELRSLTLLDTYFEKGVQSSNFDFRTNVVKDVKLASGFSMKQSSLILDHRQLLDIESCERRANEFRRLASDLHSQQNINLEGHNAAVDAMILSAECFINPFMMSAKEYPEISDQEASKRSPNDVKVMELRKVLGKGTCKLETISRLEQKRDRVFIQILLEAAEMDKSYYTKNSEISDSDYCPYGTGAEEEPEILSEDYKLSADAITLVRKNQTLLCNFLIHQLRKEEQALHGTLMQCLVFLLHSATNLVCSPDKVIDIILDSSEHLNKFLTPIYQQCQKGALQLSPEKVYRVHRHWTSLQSLVIASSGGNEGPNNVPYSSGLQYGTLIPPSIWISKIPTFTSSAFPLVRYLGCMAISRIAKGYITQRLLLTSNLSELTHLLSIFADDLATLDFDGTCKKESLDLGVVPGKKDIKVSEKLQYDESSFAVRYPDLNIFFPDMPGELKAFRECILKAVAMQLRSVPSTAVTDILCWLSDLCLSPFLEKADKAHDSLPPVKGYRAKNAKAIVLYVFEAIISEHMEAVVPELPRLVQVLGSLCRSSYCDVPFLRSILTLLKPIISYSLSKISNEEKHLAGESCLNFESLCFNELFTYLQQEEVNSDSSTKRVNIALVIFILAFVFGDLSVDRKREVIQLSVRWVDFPGFGPTSMFHDYLCSFQLLLRSCNDFSVKNLRMLGFIPMPQASDVNILMPENKGSESSAWFPDDFCYGRPTIELGTEEDASTECSHLPHQSSMELESLCGDIISLISKLNFTLESSWNLHPQLCRVLVDLSCKCLVYSRFLSSVTHEPSGPTDSENENTSICKSSDEFLTHWKLGMKTLTENIVAVQEKSCWEVAFTMIDCVLRVPTFCSLENVIVPLASVIEKIMHSAPKISWRLRTSSWLSNLFSRGILMHEEGISLVELISKMLSHPEPEQRFTALTLLGRLFGLDVDGGWVVLTSLSLDKLASRDSIVSISESVLSQLVSNTWYPVAFMASADASLHLRTLAKALLVHFIPFAVRVNLQSFLENAHTFFPGLGNFAYPMGEGLFVQLSLALIAGVCLYCPAEDLSLVPQNVWRYIETLAGTKIGRIGEMERRICEALCKVKHGEDDSKTVLKEALSCCPPKELDPEFGNTRESVLQVLANLTSVQSYFDIFEEKMNQEAAELEEAELEMEILQNEFTMQGDARDGGEILFASSTTNGDHRLQQIKDAIRSLEKTRLKEEIFARRQKKLLLRRARQKYLEDADLREAELLQELDRQKTSEIEKEIERQRLLELERSKTNELRHNLDLEKERQAQREIQRELEQVESGSRQPRREFSSSAHSSRPRDRYRDRDNGRSTGDGSFRGSATSLQPDMPVNTPSNAAPHSVVLSGSRAFSGQLPTILQARDRAEEPTSLYDENFDGSKDSGETSSTGDPELASGFDGLPTAFGSSQRQGPRGGKSRQILDRRERDGRREGKWERKH